MVKTLHIKPKGRSGNPVQLTERFQRKASHKIILSSSEGLSIVLLRDIVHLQGDGNYCRIFLSSGEKIMVTRTLKEFEEVLPSGSFYRTHQSHILNLDHVRKYLKEDGGQILMSDDSRLPVSRRKKEAFIAYLKSCYESC